MGDSERKDCPYCPGELEPLEDHPHTYQCSNLTGCPATFVAVIP